ncbi:hypothetical protein F8A10_09980 [Paracoccus kondratievae]|uniref:Uncharacterized protein n=1 Tax=Paracoccus kondratievae TaxID=135740 RepID=A0AAD3P131_9RHOB|nr:MULTISPECIES: hypothetical protein [Paracoccus]QFQ87738.1 hypothetical protein F8A10_09980 [Paracoccus kondratievae]GLK65559.1 hypothetical protein GCM10017635_30360 [Paracoccus kondratievae]SMG26100.1 hypothetical protein SAMN02746000_01480 [Paracoccus sp. J56]
MRRRDGPRPEVLLALCGAGFLLFNFPLLLIWDQPLTILGLPLLPVVLFVVWGGLIAALAWVSARSARPPRSDRAGNRRKGE